MRFIGITGGVGAGKSAILSYLAEKPKTRVMLADEIAHELMQPGTECYNRICEIFNGEDIFRTEDEHGGVKSAENRGQEDTVDARARGFDRVKLAAVIFSDADKRKQMNDIVHPAVKEYVRVQAKEERERGELSLLVLEAALLIEEHYDEICDELWYIYTSEEIREKRLMESRGYSAEKVYQIFASQLDEATYRRHCKVTIDNNGTVEEAFVQIDEILKQA